MPLRRKRSNGLLLVGACVLALAIFAGVAGVSQYRTQARVAATVDMLKSVPDLLTRGAASGIFTEGRTDDDVTGYHPAFLMGAISPVLARDDNCPGSISRVMAFGIWCRLPAGSLAIESNMMPQLVFAVAGNSFDASGRPLDGNGQPLARPENRAMSGTKESFMTIRYFEGTPDHVRVSDVIVAGLTGLHLSDVTRDGNWLPARTELGFRTCYASKDSQGVYLTCYRA